MELATPIAIGVIILACQDKLGMARFIELF